MPEPVFDANDRTVPSIPKELEGKSAAEIVKHFQKREQEVIAQAREAIRTNNPGAVPGAPAPKEPGTTVRAERPTETPVPSGELDAARNTLRQTAKRESSQGKKYWGRFVDQIDAVMSKMGPEQQVDVQFWDAVYYNLLGQHKDAIEAEEKEAAATAAKLASERPAGGSEQTPPPAPLPVQVAAKILPGLDITEAQYRKGQEAIDSGKWPLTFDSKVGRTA